MIAGVATMSESNTFASLGPTLLARKGGAKPAMRRQVQPVGQFEQSAAANPSPADLEDLGWNDMGEDVAAALTPAPHAPVSDDHYGYDQRPEPEVVRQRETLAQRLSEPANDSVERPAPRGSAPKSSGKRAAFTLRLDAERHLKLRLAATVRNRSAQQIVTEALDRLLAEMPELAVLARQVGSN